MKLNIRLVATFASAFLATSVGAISAEETLPAATKRIFNENKDSVVWVSTVAKISIGTSDSKTPMNIPDQERKFETLGTVIDSSGLVIAALSAIDPSKELTGREVNTPSGRVKLDASATLKEVKIVLPDGTEVPSDVVMKDSDLDLAFIKARADSKEAKGATFKAVNLKNSAVGGIADDVVTVVRMDELLNRQPGVQGGQIIAITQKPRAFLRVSGTGLGCPTFAMDGRLLGINVARSAREKMPVGVLIPSADVLEIAEQAKTAKPVPTEEPKGKAEKKAENQQGNKAGDK